MLEILVDLRPRRRLELAFDYRVGHPLQPGDLRVQSSQVDPKPSKHVHRRVTVPDNPDWSHEALDRVAVQKHFDTFLVESRAVHSQAARRRRQVGYVRTPIISTQI